MSIHFHFHRKGEKIPYSNKDLNNEGPSWDLSRLRNFQFFRSHLANFEMWNKTATERISSNNSPTEISAEGGEEGEDLFIRNMLWDASKL